MKKILILLFLLFPFSLLADSPMSPIPADEAFQFSATAKDNQTLIAIWQIKKGFYLYRDRIHFSPVKPNEDRLGQPLWPDVDDYKHYPGIGKLPVYTGQLRIPIPIITSRQPFIAFQAAYQGCSEAGFCYPPITKTVQVDLTGHYMKPVQALAVDIAPQLPTLMPSVVIPPQNQTTQLLQHKNLFLVLVTFFGFGLLLSLTPCVLPMIPILSGIIVGQRDATHARAFTLSLAYVLGMAVTYAIAGVIFGWIGGTVQAIFQQPWIIILFSLIFIALAFSLFGFYELQLPERWRQGLASASNQQKRGTYIGVAIMGCLSTLIVSPCVTPPLVGALGYISQTGHALFGGAALFVMGIGMGIPLMVIGAFGTTLLPKAGAWMNSIKMVLGLLMLAVAIWMLARILPGHMTMILWGALAIGSSIAFGGLSSPKSRRQRIGKLLGILLFIYGIVLLIGSFFGNTNPLRPLNFSAPIQQRSATNFILVKTIQQAEEQLHIAASEQTLTLFDFYADWCVSCKEMDMNVFNNSNVKNALSQFRLIRANVTNNDASDKKLEQHFSVVAPPSILFFDTHGNEIPGSRIVGVLSAKAFIRHLQQIQRHLK